MNTLVKGQKIDITKGNPNLSAIQVKLGWDVNQQSAYDFDLDVSALLLDGSGKILSPNHIAYYNQLSILSGAVTLSNDNQTGAGEGIDEEVVIQLQALPSQVERIVLAITIHDAEVRNQQFGQVQNAFVRIDNYNTQNEMFAYHLGTDFSNKTAVIVGEVYRYKQEWKFSAVGQGLNVGLDGLSQQFGLKNTSHDFFQKNPAVINNNNNASSSKIKLSKIELKKSGDAINLQKTSKTLGEILVNLNWNQQIGQKSGGFFSTLFGTQNNGVDLDLGCLFEFKDGYKGVIQPLGNSFGSFNQEPYIHLDQDDRTGASANGENLRINGNKIKDFKRILIFALIYDGVANWAQVDGVVTLKQQEGPDIIVRMDNHRNGVNMCAVAMLENVNNETFKVQKLVKYFSGHKEMDRHYGWNMKWVAGSK